VLNKKLGSVGIAIRHGVSFHGLALNVNLSLEPFSWVNPCGLKGVEMTTLSRECGRDVTLSMVKMYLQDLLSDLFQRQFIEYQKDQIDGSVQ
jgi:lipoyl(octanoyl) transferase